MSLRPDIAAVLSEKADGAFGAGDCKDVLAEMPEACVDSIITDPPAGIGFMGKEWDSHRGGRENWTGWLSRRLVQCFRVLKPGGSMLVWAIPRTSHWTACAVEDAGFVIRDKVYHFFGSGFPKSLDISKAIDKAAPRVGLFAGFAEHYAERRRAKGLSHREICEAGGFFAEHNHGGASTNWEAGHNVPTREQWDILRPMLGLADEWLPLIERVQAEREVTGRHDGHLHAEWENACGGNRTDAPKERRDMPATEAAQLWNGWGTALKPACEEWIWCMKPLDGTFAQNALKWGVAGLWIDGGRIGTPDDLGRPLSAASKNSPIAMQASPAGAGSVSDAWRLGRWPPNVALTHSPDCVCRGRKKVKGTPDRGLRHRDGGGDGPSVGLAGTKNAPDGYAGPDGKEEVEDWDCVPECPVRMLDEMAGNIPASARPGSAGKEYRRSSLFRDGANEQHGSFHSDVGGASRFFYTGKASRAERERGLRGHVPCVKCGKLHSKTHERQEAIRENAVYGRDERPVTTMEAPCIRNNHPTVKPVSLMEWLVRLTKTPTGGIILDPFMGSGSTLVAAKRIGRPFIGLDLDKANCEIARWRVAAVQRRLFAETLEPIESEPCLTG